MMPSLIDYHILTTPNPGPITGQLYEYVFASNGTFVRARREGLEICLPVGSNFAPVRGLQECEWYVELSGPKVSGELLRHFLAGALAAKDEHSRPLELLGYCRPNIQGGKDGWSINLPAQRQTAGSCNPIDPTDPKYLSSLIEIHSHHGMAAFFSGQDDTDEQGFKVYAVLGNIFTRPQIRVRIGLYGYFWEIPASEIFDLPAGIEDAVHAVESEEVYA